MRIFITHCIFFAISVVLLNSCCPFKTKFTDKELKWIDPYEEGDTLIFRSSTGEMDTSWIVQKVIYYPECNPIANDAKYKFHTARVFYQNSKMKYDGGGRELISVTKYTDRTSLTIDYITSLFVFYDFENRIDLSRLSSIKRQEEKKVFIFKDMDKRSKPDDIEFLYWHDDYGLIKYIMHSGLVWKRINLGFEIE